MARMLSVESKQARGEFMPLTDRMIPVANGIQELSFDEIESVGGGDQATYDYGKAIGGTIRDGFKWVYQQISDASSTIAGWLE